MRFKRYDLVLALFPNARGFAYAAFEGPLSPIDWGVSDVYGKDKAAKALRLIRRTFQSLSPDILVLRGLDEAVLKGNRRLQTLMKGIGELAAELNIPVVRISRMQIQQSFSFLGNQASRYEIVVAIAKRIVAFERYVPRARKLWESEDRRMGLFDAAALALTFYRSLADSVAQQ